MPRENFEEIISKLLSEGKNHNIVLLSLGDFLRARRQGEYREYVQNAALVIPISRCLVRGAKFLTGQAPERYMPFNFIINLLTILERREKTVYLLGGKVQVLGKAEKHIRETFPKLRVVGRFPGAFKKQNEEGLIQTIRKTAPQLLLVNNGVRGGERWIHRNSARLSQGLRIWCSDIFDVFAERRRRPSQVVFDYGLEWVGFCFKNPMRIFRVFRFIYYNILLIVFKLNKN
jgi:N-acetylglucosaminyldiphosphoundecaprenol N-acetyl-beta-D-mannosaminyltransferase